jgi:hypothetical protein
MAPTACDENIIYLENGLVMAQSLRYSILVYKLNNIGNEDGRVQKYSCGHRSSDAVHTCELHLLR